MIALSILCEFVYSGLLFEAEIQGVQSVSAWLSCLMNRRQELQHDLHQVVQSRAQLSRLFTAARRVQRRGSVGAVRLSRKRKSLALLRLIVEIGGLNPVAVLTARNLLKRPRDSDASMEAECGTLQALLDTRQCRADTLLVNRDGQSDVLWRKALRLVAECLLLEELYQMNLRGSTPTGRHLWIS